MLQASTIPVLFAASAAAFFGAQAIFAKRSLAYVDPQAGAMITIGTSALIYWLLSPFLLNPDAWLSPALWIFLLNGLIHPMFSMYLSFEANKHMGPTVSSTLAATAPLFATAGAVAALNEELTWPILLGTVVTVAGIMVLSWDRSGLRAWALSALFFPFGAAIIRASNHIIGKFGLEILPDPFFAGLVSFSVSTVGSILLYRWRNGMLPYRLPARGLGWNVLGGACVAIAILCMYSALSTGLVVVVSPIIATYPLFTLIFSLIFRQERLSLRISIAALLVVAGVGWISLH